MKTVQRKEILSFRKLDTNQRLELNNMFTSQL